MAQTVPPRVISVNVGLPRQIAAGDQLVATAIYKAPVAGKVAVKKLNLAGDQQADLAVHGGPNKAVYAYPSEHYPYWRAELPDLEMPWGMLGENLTTEGITEEVVHIGDELRIGSALLQVTQPRLPCYKLALKLGRSDVIEKFWNSGLSGLYFSVLQEGVLEAGDRIEFGALQPDSITIADLLRLYRGQPAVPGALERALSTPSLSDSWKIRLRERRALLAE